MDKEISHPPSLAHSILQMIQAALTGSMTFDTFNNILALLCLISILQRMPQATSTLHPDPQPVSNSSGSGDALQKMLAQLAKSDSGGNDGITSLLPLLNSPQLKSKMTPANMATIMGLLSTMNVGETKPDKNEKEKDNKKDGPAATITADHPSAEECNPLHQPENLLPMDQEDMNKQRLEWKTNF